MFDLRFVLTPAILALLAIAGAMQPEVQGLLTLALALLAAEEWLELQETRGLRAGIRAIAAEHLEALALAKAVQELAQEASPEESLEARAMLGASPAMARGTAKVLVDTAKVLVAKGASGER